MSSSEIRLSVCFGFSLSVPAVGVTLAAIFAKTSRKTSFSFNLFFSIVFLV